MTTSGTPTDRGPRRWLNPNSLIPRSAATRYKWLLLALLGVIGFILGFVGLEEYHAEQGDDVGVLDLIFLDLKLLAVDFGGAPDPPVPVALGVARFLLPLVVLAGAITGLLALFRDRYQQARLPFLRGHVLIVGLGDKGLAFAQAMRADGERVVVIDADAMNQNIAAARETGATVVIGRATDEGVLTVAGVRRAKYLIGTADDATNAEITLLAERLVRTRRRGTALECLVHVVNPALCRLLNRQALESAHESGLRVDFFNFYEQAAQIACGRTLADDRRVVVIGDSPLVESVVLRVAAARPSRGDRLPEVLLLHPAAQAELQTLNSRHPHLERLMTMTAVDVELDARLVRAFVAFAAEVPSLCYVCTSDDAAGVETALALRGPAQQTGSRIIVCTSRSGGLASVLTEDREGRSNGDKLAPLSAVTVLALTPETCTSDLVRNGVSELLARAIHDDYVSERRKRAEFSDEDPALVSWEQLLPDLKESNRRQATHICTKLREIGCYLEPLEAGRSTMFEFSPEEFDRLARLEHERWMSERIKAGWIYGAVRDPVRKASPDLVPWPELTEGSRDKDREAIRRIPSLANLAGFHIQRFRAPGMGTNESNQTDH